MLNQYLRQSEAGLMNELDEFHHRNIYTLDVQQKKHYSALLKQLKPIIENCREELEPYFKKLFNTTTPWDKIKNIAARAICIISVMIEPFFSGFLVKPDADGIAVLLKEVTAKFKETWIYPVAAAFALFNLIGDITVVNAVQEPDGATAPALPANTNASAVEEKPEDFCGKATRETAKSVINALLLVSAIVFSFSAGAASDSISFSEWFTQRVYNPLEKNIIDWAGLAFLGIAGEAYYIMFNRNLFEKSIDKLVDNLSIYEQRKETWKIITNYKIRNLEAFIQGLGNSVVRSLVMMYIVGSVGQTLFSVPRTDEGSKLVAWLSFFSTLVTTMFTRYNPSIEKYVTNFLALDLPANLSYRKDALRDFFNKPMGQFLATCIPYGLLAITRGVSGAIVLNAFLSSILIAHAEDRIDPTFRSPTLVALRGIVFGIIGLGLTVANFAAEYQRVIDTKALELLNNKPKDSSLILAITSKESETFVEKTKTINTPNGSVEIIDHEHYAKIYNEKIKGEFKKDTRMNWAIYLDTLLARLSRLLLFVTTVETFNEVYYGHQLNDYEKWSNVVFWGFIVLFNDLVNFYNGSVNGVASFRAGWAMEIWHQTFGQANNEVNQELAIIDHRLTDLNSNDDEVDTGVSKSEGILIPEGSQPTQTNTNNSSKTINSNFVQNIEKEAVRREKSWWQSPGAFVNSILKSEYSFAPKLIVTRAETPIVEDVTDQSNLLPKR